MNESKNSDSSSRWTFADSVPARIFFPILTLAFITVVCYSIYAFHENDQNTYRYLEVVMVSLVVVAILGIAAYYSRKNLATIRQKDLEGDLWLVRLVVITVLGMCAVVLYAEQWPKDNAVRIATLGLLVAGATSLTSLVVGFLFGIPHTRQSDTKKPSEQQSDSGAKDAKTVTPKPDGGEKSSGANPGTNRPYSGSTNLEQVSDWLTKIIVGVGLTELKGIPSKLDSLATYIAEGMGSDPSHKTFALAIVLYFSACGFLFGFLWARLFMGRAFSTADNPAESSAGLTK